MRKMTRKRVGFALLCFLLSFFIPFHVKAQISKELKADYTNRLSNLVRSGVTSANMDNYRKIYNTKTGRKCLKTAVLNNRASLIAEKIDALDDNWKNYYRVTEKGGHIIFTGKKMVSRSSYKKRYKEVRKGLNRILSQVEGSMNSADIAVELYAYLSKNTFYRNTSDSHTGYDVLTRNTGVCDGMSNVYAMALNALDIPCIVVSNYSKDHSWNMVKISGTWYLCDLTMGVGPGLDLGLVMRYDSCLVGMDTFLATHYGYSKKDLYGEGNSDGLKISKLKISKSDYMGKSLREGLREKTTTFYANGYWYWISTSNELYKSHLNGSGKKLVYHPENNYYIGWIEYYNGKIIMSINDTINAYDEDKGCLSMIYRIPQTEYYPGQNPYLWEIGSVNRFVIGANGKMSYHVTDYKTTKAGKRKISLGKLDKSRVVPKLSQKNLTMIPGESRNIYLLGTKSPKNDRILWTSSNKNIVKVDKYGRLKALKPGTATITVKWKSKRAACKVYVKWKKDK